MSRFLQSRKSRNGTGGVRTSSTTEVFKMSSSPVEETLTLR